MKYQCSVNHLLKTNIICCIFNILYILWNVIWILYVVTSVILFCIWIYFEFIVLCTVLSCAGGLCTGSKVTLNVFGRRSCRVLLILLLSKKITLTWSLGCVGLAAYRQTECILYYSFAPYNEKSLQFPQPMLCT